MIIRDCPNVLCRDPLYTGECKKECIKRWERELGVKQKDLVEVVRCKYCKCLHIKTFATSQFCSLSGIPVEDDDFCSYGERKDNV